MEATSLTLMELKCRTDKTIQGRENENEPAAILPMNGNELIGAGSPKQKKIFLQKPIKTCPTEQQLSDRNTIAM